MKIRLEGILEQVQCASALEHMQCAIEALRDAFAVHHVVYHWVSAAGDQYGCGTYSPEWVARYVAREYLRIDPVVLGCLQNFLPVDWKCLNWSSKAAREFQADAHCPWSWQTRLLGADPGAQRAVCHVHCQP
jgi:hypothetical protein